MSAVFVFGGCLLKGYRWMFICGVRVKGVVAACLVLCVHSVPLYICNVNKGAYVGEIMYTVEC